MIEVEYKYAVESSAAVKTKLAALGGRHVATHQQEDLYFNHQLDNFKQKDIAFRIRRSDDDWYLTYKGPNQDSVGKIREEVEMPLVNAAATQQLRQILAGVGFDAVSSVQKQRDSYELTIANQTAEACVDEVTGLGSFVELEIVVADQSHVAAAKIAIEKLADQLGVVKPIRTSYLDLLMEKLEKKV